ncbi:MAG: TatA/E family twin arginine-targeting protein translocase [Acidobacteria bacterium]|nr:TatA/E family twin arginine-targeting protein translocase [Acidobacteriota bacterium]
MFGPIGMPELVIIFVIALIVFGPRKLPELGKSLGKSLSEFKKASNELRNSLEEEIRVEEEKDRTPRPAPAVAAAPAVASTAVADTPPVEAAPAASDDPYTDDFYDRAQDETRGQVADTTPRGADV